MQSRCDVGEVAPSSCLSHVACDQGGTVKLFYCSLSAVLCLVHSSIAQIKWVTWMQSEGSVGQAIAADKRGHIYVAGISPAPQLLVITRS
jgi:hypothetical protein